ncbi:MULTISPECIES: glucosylglycerol-phosphate synthase [unclassified Polaromonas]|jgi:glucosylglycerol-phosphate synthase|uniref:glucosylglycerol-phosphate synthase n=1 Tax=unclassified Polaromonas TaxID=2638319 RepID=UPI0018C9CBA6|nr:MULTISPECIES: glucosylglycerol-phosphate synthase [unclassified Polaromonas]MBG6073223.1 glucosylglycerol-phosphate synthase [Polaromonas sp. CG_9.7]MBG6115267.1 glucosylglycerol-phosphate synthase [Polaromonas sp. CG_9.2]MDH6183493.1 glucosylglycerol-phosphate synthase [Polaromonas sp. CG_23.6]
MNTELVIVYHRQPYEEVMENGKLVLREPRSPNGILPTIKRFFSHVDKAVWVAWKKSPAGKTPNFERRITLSDSFGAYDVVRLPLDAGQINQFYHVTSKEALWPVLNSFPWLYSTENTHWATFREVNRLFAEAACEHAAPGAVVWIHDYNLWLVPKFVRQLRPDLKIAFLHHTPFPAADVFNIMPWRDEILDSLLACDMVGFHIPRYSQNFCALAEGLRAGIVRHEAPVPEPIHTTGMAMSETVVTTHLDYQGRRILIDTWPIGTSPDLIAETVDSEDGRARTANIRRDMNAEILIVSVSRVDYAKGTRQQLEAFERMLLRRPELAGRVKLLLVTVSAADGMAVYKAEQTKIEQLVGRINGHFGTMSWLPIMLSTTPMPFEEVVCAYRAADIAWITPLRDGLNLVCKEFVAAKNGESGVLVLSEFAGSAMELSDAVLVNPFSRNSMDEGLDQALDMPLQERSERMQRLLAHVRKYDLAYWTKHVMSQFAKLTADEKPAP